MYLDDDDAYQPDLVFVSTGRAGIVQRDGIYGAPDLVVEVLSPSNRSYDLGPKRAIYETAGVAEYWIVDPERRVVEVLANGPNGFVRHDRADGHGSGRSAVLDGFALDAARLFEGT